MNAIHTHTHTHTVLASFPGLHTIQFLIALIFKNKGGRPGPLHHMNISVSTYVDRGGEEGEVSCIVTVEYAAICPSGQLSTIRTVNVEAR